MGESGHDPGAAASLYPPQDNRFLLKWLETQPEETQSNITREKLQELLTKAAQPRHASGNACVKLCYFIEQCQNSESSILRGNAFSEKTCLSIFNFYIDWNEKNQHRSMRQVLELLSSLVSRNPDQQTGTSVKSSILQRSMSIITHQAAQPLVKPAFKALECLLSKKTISTHELIHAYRHHSLRATSSVGTTQTIELDATWDYLFAEIFEWMTLADISPATGKFLVTVFRELRSSSDETESKSLTASWQRWIRQGLSKQPEALENVKNYLFPPLFKLDRPGSLLFLEDLNKQSSVWDMKNQDFDAQSLLQLAAIEAGKKSGLIEEPSTIQFQKAPKRSAGTIVLQEDALSALLAHASATVRSLAFSVLVSSNSSIRPFSPTALKILQPRLHVLYCDTDAKFRNEILSNTKHMIERLRGATAFLAREIASLSFQLRPQHPISAQERQMAQQSLEQTTELLRVHANFIEWFIEFLLGELISTASYQRHITALKAISILLRSGILRQTAELPPVRMTDNSTVWPCMIDFFNTASMRLLLDLLMDPFEDVRSSATNILKLASPDNFTAYEASEEPWTYVDTPNAIIITENLGASDREGFAWRLDLGCEAQSSHVRNGKPLGLLRGFIDRAEELSKITGRADYADGVARSYELLYSLLPSTKEQIQLLTQLVDGLETKVSIAEQDLVRAVLDAPVHGTFAAISFVWDSIDSKDLFRPNLPPQQEDTRKYWDSLQLRLVHLCTRIWEVVKDILCNDSPEGHLPHDLDEADVIDTKDVLSYSFRAVHESSNLLQTMLDQTRLRWESSLSPPPSEIFATIGNLTFLQLSSLRHRGAFSTVSLTFTKCCVLTKLEPRTPSSTPNQLSSWYEGALCCIHEQASTTRRSAGIPALLTAIMSAQATVPSFDQVMAKLMALADQPVESTSIDETNLFQVHALNSLKEIFKSTTLGKRSERYIAQCFELAVKSLRSQRWAIRNCGLILLRSIIDRLFGTSESKTVTESGWDGKSIKLAYEAYPSLSELLDNLLKADSHSNNRLGQPALGIVELVFPALDVIRRSGPPDSHRDSIINSVQSHLGSNVWHVREIAAHTICTLVLNTAWVSSIKDLLKTPTNSANRRHGVLLAVKYILERRFALDPATTIAGVLDLAPELRRNAVEDSRRFKNFAIVTNHIEISNAIAFIILSWSDGKSDCKEQLDWIKDALFDLDWRLGYPTMEEILEQFYPNFRSTMMSASQCFPSLTRLAVYMTAMRNDNKSLLAFVKYSTSKHDDLAIAALECIPNAWKHVGALSGLCEVYSAVIRSTRSGEVHSIARTNLAELLDRPFSLTDSENEKVCQILLKLLPDSFARRRSFAENVLQSRIKLGGCILVAVFNSTGDSHKDFQESLQVWGCWLTWGGAADADFDLRLAVASGLHSFYCNLDMKRVKKLDNLIPSLLALYVSLNDDDEDIRNLAAKTISFMLKRSLAPPAAREEFLEWLQENYNTSSQFTWNVMCQMTGSTSSKTISYHSLMDPLVSAKTQFEKGLENDDTLFVEEEQNLFVDEVNQVTLWSKLFWELPVKVFKTPREDDQESFMLLDFAAWVSNAVTVLNETMPEDGPLGWASKPRRFTATFRVLRCANTLLDYHYKHFRKSPSSKQPQLVFLHRELNSHVGSIISTLQKFRREAIGKNIHPILIEELGKQKRLDPIPESLFRKISLKFTQIRGVDSEQTDPL